MCFCRVGIPLILGGLKITKYVQYLVWISRQIVLQRPHIAQVSYISFLVTDFAISLIRFMVSARHEYPTRSAMSPAFRNGVFFAVLCLFFAKHAWLLKCLLHSAQGIRTAEKTHRGLAKQSLHVWSHTCVKSRLHPLLHALHTYRLAMAPVRFTITW
jgi:hypothetical protein